MKMEMTRPATRIELAERVDELQEKLEKQDKDLEIWKKIAEFLAEEVKEQAKYQKYCTTDNCTYEKTNCDITCIIDWARKEVENGDNN